MSNDDYNVVFCLGLKSYSPPPKSCQQTGYNGKGNNNLFGRPLDSPCPFFLLTHVRACRTFVTQPSKKKRKMQKKNFRHTNWPKLTILWFGMEAGTSPGVNFVGCKVTTSRVTSGTCDCRYSWHKDSIDDPEASGIRLMSPGSSSIIWRVDAIICLPKQQAPLARTNFAKRKITLFPSVDHRMVAG